MTLLGTAMSGKLSVGYYGGRDATGRMRFTKVHVHEVGRGPVCGARIAPHMGYQWCSNGSLSYVECERCEKVIV